MRLVFMGTPEFARRSLVAVASAGHEVTTVVTQPDRPKGRGYQLQASPVKEEALRRQLTVLQPERVSEPGFVSSLREQDPQAIVVVAFGQKIPPEILTMAPLGCVNVHGSLLPRYRGAAPIQRAVMNGDALSGVCTMYMDEGWDTGDMILCHEMPIGPNETAGELHDRLADAGAELLVKTLRLIELGEAPRVHQDHDRATYAAKIGRAEGDVDWQQPASEIHNRVRGLNPAPGAYTWFEDSLVKVWRTRLDPSPGQPSPDAAPGEIVAVDEHGPWIKTGAGCIALENVQPQGGRPMTGLEYVRGRHLASGARFGSQQGRG